MSPSSSEAQRRSACAALSAKVGKTPKDKLQGAAKSMYKSMSIQQLSDFCKGKVEE